MIGRWLSEYTWRRSASLTPNELAVVKALVPANDPRSKKLIRQAEQAPKVNRTRLTRSKYEATIAYVRDAANLVDIDTDIVSPQLRLVLARTLKPVSFKIKVLRGGFLYQIEGESVDGSDWDVDWEPTAESLSEALRNRAVGNWLPVAMCEEERRRILSDLEDWLSVSRGAISKYDSDQLSVVEGSDVDQLVDCERSYGLTLPNGYKEFLTITNGLTLHRGRPFAIYGTGDLYRVDLEHSAIPLWLITDLYEQGAVVMPAEDTEELVVYLAPATGPLKAISSLTEYVRDSFTLLESE